MGQQEMQELKELRTLAARIDERTILILEEQKELNNRFDRHEKEDREDFKEVHHRISRTERKVNWILGIGSGTVFLIGTLAAYLKLAGVALAAIIGG